MRRSKFMRIDTKRLKPGTGLANYEVDGIQDDDEEGSKLQRRHSERQTGAAPREKRRNSAPGTALKIPRFFSREKSDVETSNHGNGNEWNTCNNLKLSRGSDSGRVKVFVRIRPFRHEEAGHGGSLPFSYIKDEAQISWLSDDKSTEKTITFDHLFTQEENNKEVCNTLTGPLIHSAMNGFNGTLMAYGQTCSGKTYTLMSDSGITQSLVKRCFARIQGASKHNFKVTVSYLQIYQEKIFDLLKEGSETVELAIRENPHTGIYVENLTEYVVRSPHEVQQYIEKGKQSLMFSETKMNQCSSRSHAVLQITIERTKNEKTDKLLAASMENDIDEDNEENEEVESKDKISRYLDSFGKDVIIRGKIHICDLAGSERIKRAGDNRLLETQAINSSLLELGNVIQALADDKATHVPYRNSMLTRLLQESLGGNCKTGLIICVSPSPLDFQETKCSLNFGQRASKVRNKAYINMEVDYKKLSEHLMKEIDSKEIEMRQLKAMKDDGGKRESLQKRYEEVKRETQVQKELHTKELEELQEEIFVLNEQVYTHKEQIAECESSGIATTHALANLKNSQFELIKTENAVGGLFDQIATYSSNDQYSLLKSFYKFLLMYSEKSDDEVAIRPDVELSEYFAMLRDKTENIQIDKMGEEASIKGLTEMKVVLDKLRDDLIDENVSKLGGGIDEDKTSDSGIEEDKLTDTEVNVLRYKVVLKGFVNFTANSLELLHVRLKSECFEEETQKLSSDFQSYKSTKDLLFTELARARKEERDFLSNENLGLQSKMMALEESIKELEEEKQNTNEREDSEKLDEIHRLEEENRGIAAQFQNYKLTTELSLTQMEKARKAEKVELSKEMTEEISRLQRENNGLLSRIREYTTTIKEQENEIINCNNIMRKMEYEIKELGYNADSYDRERREHARYGREPQHRPPSREANEFVNMEEEIETLNMRIRELKKNEMDKDDEILKLQLESINRICDSTNFTSIENTTEMHILSYKIQSMESDIQKLQSNINQYQQQLMEKKEEVVNLREEHRDLLNHARESMYSRESEANVKELSEQIAIADIEVTDLHTKIDVLERAVEVKKIEITKLQRQHNSAMARACDSPSSAVGQESEINNLKSAVAKNESENDQLRSEIKMFERKAADKENDLVKIRKLHNEELAQMRESAASMSRDSEMSLTNRINEIRDLNAALRQMETQNDDLVYKVKVFDRKEEDTKKEISRLLTERDDSIAHFHRSLSTSKENERDLLDLNNKIMQIEVEKKDLQSKLTFVREKEEYTEKEMKKLREDRNEVEKQAQEASSKVREKESKIADLNNLIKELQDENIELFSKISIFEKTNEDKQNEILRMQKEYDISTVVNERKNEIATMNVTIMKLQAENETFQSKVKYLEQREEDNRNELKSLQQERSDSVKQVLECASTARERENEMKSMNIKLTQVENEKEDLRSKVKTFEKKKEENKKRFAKLQSDQGHSEKEVKEVRSQVSKLEEVNEELRSKLSERRDDEKRNSIGKQKGMETTTRIGHTIYTARYHENDGSNKQTTTVKETTGEISKMVKLTELEMENHELRSKIKVFKEIIEEDKKNEIQQNDKILNVQTAHHSLMNELESCKTRMEEKENTLKKMNPELAEIKHEKSDLLVKLEAYKQIIKQKESKVKELEGKLNDLGKNEYSYSNKLNKRNNETIALQTANEKLLTQITSYKSAVEMHKKSNEEAHEEVTKLTLENSNLMSQFECFLTAINKKEKLCKKLVAKVCDLEVINEKLFQSISQSVNDNAEQNGEDDFGKACNEKMKDLLANALVEQEERLVAEITTENIYENSMQRSERISINTTSNVPKRGLSDKSLMSSVYNTLKSAEKAQLDIKEKLSVAENEVTELQNKCRYLETSVMKLQKEKKEYLGIILELTHSSREGKIQHSHQCHDNHSTKVDNYSQTDDLSTPQHSKTKHTNSKGKHALKVAHIKPLVNNETDKDNDILDVREASERVKVENGGREEYSMGRGGQFSPFGSPQSHRTANVDSSNTRERRRQETTRYSSICSKENAKRNSDDSALGSSSPLHSSSYSESSEVRTGSVQEKRESEHMNGEENKTTFNTALSSSSYTDERRNDRSESRPLPPLPNEYEANARNYGKPGHEYLESGEKKSNDNYHVASKYTSRHYRGSRDGPTMESADKYNDEIKGRESLASRSPTSPSNSHNEYEESRNNMTHDFNGYHESKEKTIEVCSAYLSSKCIDGKENKNLKLKPATNLTNSKRYHTINLDSTTNDISKLCQISESNITAPVTSNSSIYVSKYSPSSRFGTKENEGIKSSSKIANRYGLDIDLTEEGSPSSYPYTSHYNSIIHKYDRFSVASKR